MADKSVNISEREHFKIMVSVFEEMMDIPEYKVEIISEALTMFSNKAHKKIFSPRKERLKASPRVESLVKEVLGGE